MAFGFTLPTSSRSLASLDPVRSVPLPSPLGTKAIAFVFVALAEYWISPIFLGIGNEAGTWADLGMALFFVWVAALFLFLVLPLRTRLLPLLRDRAGRWTFYGAWTGSVIGSLFVTNTLQVGPTGPSPWPVAWGSTTVYTPFGAWPTATVTIPALQLYGAINVEILTVVGLLGFLWASVLLLARAETRSACPAVPRTRKARWASLTMWTPVGFLTGCSACTPVYLALLGAVAPGAASGGYSFLPFAPWQGFAGLLYLVSFSLAIVLVRRTTAPTEPEPTSSDRPSGDA